jgi:hypothetical protein
MPMNRVLKSVGGFGVKTPVQRSINASRVPRANGAPFPLLAPISSSRTAPKNARCCRRRAIPGNNLLDERILGAEMLQPRHGETSRRPLPRMKIARIETFCVSPRWIFIRVETDSGLVGWGESICPKRVNAVLGAITDLTRNVIGEDPLRIEDLWQRMYRGGFFRGGPILSTAVAGIEQALWDIKGKYYNMPVHEFLGGRVRDKVRAYAWIGGDRPDNVVAMAKARVAQGFTAVKMNATPELHYLDHP